jgi:hypothetical protein
LRWISRAGASDERHWSRQNHELASLELTPYKWVST